MAWLVEHCSNLLLLFHKGEPHDGHTAGVRLKGKPWRGELSCRASVSASTTESALDTVGVEVVEGCVCGCSSERLSALSWTRLGHMLFNP